MTEQNKTDMQLVVSIALEITDRLKLMGKLIPEEYDEKLKHIAAASIHLIYFIRDLHEIETGESLFKAHDELVKIFLEKCGCDMKDKIKNE